MGAGIGGAVLALALGRRGHRVVVLEREASPRKIVRPEILWNPTLDLLDGFGLGDSIRNLASVRLEEVNVGGYMRMRPEDFAAARVQAYSTDPLMTRQLVIAAAEATGYVEIHRGVEVTLLLNDGGRTRGVSGRRGNETFEVCADLVVGDDGVQSLVRSRLNIGIDLQIFPIDFLTAGIQWPVQLPAGCARVFFDFKKSRSGIPAAALIPWPAQQGVLLIPLSPARADQVLKSTATEFWGMLSKTMSLAEEFRQYIQFPKDFVRVTRPFGHAASYVADGIALIGDAAHPMTPAGGQGANASIWDAVILADVAGAALGAGNTSSEKLAPYERRRRPINARSINISRVALKAFRFGNHIPLSAFAPAALRSLDFSVFPKRAILRRFGTTFTTTPLDP